MAAVYLSWSRSPPNEATVGSVIFLLPRLFLLLSVITATIFVAQTK